MLAFLILFVSVLLQFSAAICAFRLIKVTGKTYAWILISAALFLMGVRRLIPLYYAFFSTAGYTIDLTNEWIGLILSLLMLLGVLRIEPLLAERMRAKEPPAENAPVLLPVSRVANLPLLIFLALAVTIAAVGYRHLHRQMEISRLAAQDQLTAISTLKSRQIAAWHEELIEHARLIQAMPGLAGLVKSLSENPSRQDIRNQLLTLMSATGKRPEFTRILLIDQKQQVMLAFPEKENWIGLTARRFAEQANHTNDILISDLHQSKKMPGTVDMDLFVPILPEEQPAGSNVEAVGVLMIEISPDKFLFPAIQSWPTPSETAETLLVRRESNDVVFLNTLRYSAQPPLTLRLPIDEYANLPAARVVTGHEGLVEGTDYRNVSVLADVRAVPGTPWCVVAKLDRKEINTPLRRQAAQSGIAIILLILIAGLTVSILWRQHDNRRLKAQLSAEQARHEIEARYRAQFEQAGDYFMVFEIGPEGIPIITDVNEAALRAHGYTREELLGKPITILDPDVKPEVVSERMRLLQMEGTLLFNAQHRRKDGSVFDAEIRVTLVRAREKTIILSAERDITERKRSEERQEEHRKFLNNVLSSLTHPFYVIDANDYKIVMANAAAGFGNGLAGGGTCYALTHDRDRPCDDAEHFCPLGDVKRTGKPAAVEHLHRDKEGRNRNIEVHAYPILDQEGNVKQVIEYCLDITDRKRAEEALRNSEERFRLLTEESPLGVSIISPDGRYKYLNPKFTEMFGYTLEDVPTGRSWFEKAFPDDPYRDEVIAAWKSDLTTSVPGEGRPRTFSVTCKDGSKKEIYFRPVEISTGDQFVIYEDITAYRQAQEALIKSRTLLQSIVDGTPDAVYVKDLQGRYLLFSRGAERFVGKTAAEVLGKDDRAIFPPADAAAVMERDRKVIEEGAIKSFEEAVADPSGAILTFLSTKGPLFDASGKPFGLFGIARDITERKRVEEHTRAMADMLNTAPNSITVHNFEGRFLYANRRTFELHGYEEGEFMALNLHELDVPESEALIEERMRIIAEKGEAMFEVAHFRKDGTKIPLEIFVKRVNWAGEPAMLSIGTDITERKQAEKALLESESRYRTLFEQTGDYIFVLEVGPDGIPVIIDLNEAAIRAHGYTRDEMLGKSINFLDPDTTPDVHKKRIEALAGGKVSLFTVQHRRKDGSLFDVEVRAQVLRVGLKLLVVTAERDVTARTRAEKELKNSREELRSLAAHVESIREEERTRLAREMHDNLAQALTALRMDLGAMAKKVAGDPDISSSLAGTLRVLDASADSVRKLAMELRPGVLDDLGLPAAIRWQLTEFQKRTGVVCDSMIKPPDVSLSPKISTALFRILQEALANIVRHAHATEVHVLLEAVGDDVVMKIRDNGSGMPKGQATSPTALGLIGMRERAIELGGRFDVRGESGKGTTVTVTVPWIRA